MRGASLNRLLRKPSKARKLSNVPIRADSFVFLIAWNRGAPTM